MEHFDFGWTPKDTQFSSGDTDIEGPVPVLSAQPAHSLPFSGLGSSPRPIPLGCRHSAVGKPVLCKQWPTFLQCGTVHDQSWHPRLRDEEADLGEVNWPAWDDFAPQGTVPSPGCVVVDAGSLLLGLTCWSIYTSCCSSHQSCVFLGFVLKEHFLHWCFQNY